MTRQHELSDAQWCLLDVLVKAKLKGIDRVSRLEILHSKVLPQTVAVALVWAALTMPKELVVIHGQHDFAITTKGMQLYELRFGSKNVPSPVGESVICLPGPDHYRC